MKVAVLSAFSCRLYVRKIYKWGDTVNDENSIPNSKEVVILTLDDWRVEIHLRQDDGGITTMLAYSGRKKFPERSSLQGPFQCVDEAIGARRAIILELFQQGYGLVAGECPVWSLQAQRDIKAARDIKHESSLNYQFDLARDVFFDW